MVAASVLSPVWYLSVLFRILVLGVVLTLCSPAQASTDGRLHHSFQVANGHSTRRAMEVAVGSNTTGITHAPDADPDDGSSTGPTVLFNATVLANTTFSGSCVEALSATLNCSGAVAQEDYLYTWGGLTESDIETVCTESCAESFNDLRASVVTACAEDVYTDPVINDTGYIYGTGFSNDIYNVESVSVYPLAFVDYYLLSYRLLCMKDE